MYTDIPYKEATSYENGSNSSFVKKETGPFYRTLFDILQLKSPETTQYSVFTENIHWSEQKMKDFLPSIYQEIQNNEKYQTISNQKKKLRPPNWNLCGCEKACSFISVHKTVHKYRVQKLGGDAWMVGSANVHVYDLFICCLHYICTGVEGHIYHVWNS